MTIPSDEESPLDLSSRDASGNYHRLCCDSWTSQGHAGTCICPVMEMERQGCRHCREKGLYSVPDDLKIGKTKPMNLDNVEEIGVGMDDDGSVWVGPNEAFLEGRFGRGKHRY